MNQSIGGGAPGRRCGAREERRREAEGWRSRKRKVRKEVNMSIKEGGGVADSGGG